MKTRIDPLELLLEITDWCIAHPYHKEIKKYQINKMIKHATETII